MALLIGCSGWSYKDWVGPFYPKDTKQKEWLEYYGRFFPTVEINSTFYAIPNKYTIEAWIRKGRAVRRVREERFGSRALGQGGFDLSVKMNQKVTHDLLVKGKVGEALEEARDFMDAVVRPLGDLHLAGAVLIQLSPYFRFDRKDGKKNLEALDRLFEELPLHTFDHAVEFRHRTWTKKGGSGLQPEVEDLLSRFEMALVETDGPGFPDLLSEKREGPVYVRFHGRNADIWFKKGSGSTSGMESGLDEAGRFNRYDYLYSEAELGSWAQSLRTVRERMEEGGQKKAYVYFNNHPRGKGPKNALMFMDMLGIAHEPKDIRLSTQKTLF